MLCNTRNILKTKVWRTEYQTKEREKIRRNNCDLIKYNDITKRRKPSHKNLTLPRNNEEKNKWMSVRDVLE